VVTLEPATAVALGSRRRSLGDPIILTPAASLNMLIMAEESSKKNMILNISKYDVSGNQSKLHAGQQDPSWWPFNCVCPSFSKLLTFPYNSDTHEGQGFLAG